MIRTNMFNYLAFIVVGATLAAHTTFFKGEEAKADVIKPINLPTLKFEPKTNLALGIDPDNDRSKVIKDLPVTSITTTINHPTQIIEKVIYKQVKDTIYDTKVQYLVKPVLFTLPTSGIHVPNIEYPLMVKQ